jgi:hypothetical protein
LCWAIPRPGALPLRLGDDKKYDRVIKEETMGTTVKEIAMVLRSTETMADLFVQHIQERVEQPVPHAEILTVMKKIPAKSLTTNKVIAKIKKERAKRREKERKKKERAARRKKKKS